MAPNWGRCLARFCLCTGVLESPKPFRPLCLCPENSVSPQRRFRFEETGSNAMSVRAAPTPRRWPAGFSRNALTDSIAASNLSSSGRSWVKRRSPASVGATLRVVRFNSRTPSRVSSARTVWLKVVLGKRRQTGSKVVDCRRERQERRKPDLSQRNSGIGLHRAKKRETNPVEPRTQRNKVPQYGGAKKFSYIF